jgi:alginate O-acetyltransferase complex protein AlgI
LSFTDPAFLFSFLPLTLILFALAGRIYGPLGGQIVLTGATLLFCLPYGWPFLILLLVSTAVNQLAVSMLMKNTATASAVSRYSVFISALVFNFLILIVLKYGILFSAIPGATKAIAILTAAIPVTVSFLTFQRAVMILDAYQKRPEMAALTGKGLPAKARFWAFNLMFPNLVIGPIVYASEVSAQLVSKRFGKIRRMDLAVGVTLFTIGLAKKVLIADPLSLHVATPVFTAAAAGQALAPLEVIAGMLGFYAQLYFDFSGYSDMALGIARLFGLRLPFNFDSPLRSTGIVDFYKRWHITLTRVIARFMFTPLALAGTRFAAKRNFKGWRAKTFAVWLPMLINFEIIALWHGVLTTFIMFGLFHGIWFILESEIRSTKRWKAFAKRTSSEARQLAGQILTITPLVTSFALFRSDSLSSFSHLLGSLGNDWFSIFTDSSGRVIGTKLPGIYLAISFAIIWLMPNAYEFMGRYRPGIRTFSVPSTTLPFLQFRWRPTLIWALLAACFALATISELNAPVPFVYGGF